MLAVGQIGRGDGHYREVGTLLANRPEALLEALGRIETLRIRRRKVTQNRIIPREIGVIYCEKDVAHEGNQFFRARNQWRVRPSTNDRSDLTRGSCWRRLRYCWFLLDRNRDTTRWGSGLGTGSRCSNQRYTDGHRGEQSTFNQQVFPPTDRCRGLLKLPSGRDTDAAAHPAISAHIVSHATIGRERLVDTSYRLNANCLRSVVETHVRVYCECLAFRQIDAAE